MDQGFLDLSARLLRRDLRRAAQHWRYHRFSLEGEPVFFANSFPKSGTHLLIQVLNGFAWLGPAVSSGLPAVVNYRGDSGDVRLANEILADLNRLKPGDISYGHLHALPEVVSFLCQQGSATYFILRDPRDVAISHVYYVTEMAPKHAHHTFYTQELHNFDERLRTSILGRPDWDEAFPDIGKRFQPYLGWLLRPEVCTLRFEDFVHDQEASLSRVIDFAVDRGFSLGCEKSLAVEVLARGIDPRNSPTFRSGKTGGWRERFSPEHKRLFKEVAGDTLIRLGYEQDYDW
ncbi:MAG TPA: sulfotransferase domain-containing protein [Anaerolineales bacterium]|nr:sulfotransferase domain-containing protein [Anaerolineales bacterium]